MFLSSSCILVLFLSLSHECTGRHLNSIDGFAMDDNAKLLSHSTIKGFENDLVTVHDDVNLTITKKGKDQTSRVNNDYHKKTDCISQNKKDMNKDQKLKKVQEEPVHRHHHQHHPKSHATVTFRVPPRNKRVHQQPGFNLDYSPPKTHPPSHN
ncbi:hypothetical protein L1887_37181 [Cichorium endivia]|nr:hypothetical protein L1887_37181 [Cichorium endivia]